MKRSNNSLSFSFDECFALAIQRQEADREAQLMNSERIKSRCIIALLLIWILLVRLFDPALLYFIQYKEHEKNELQDLIQTFLNVIIYILLPAFGILADKFGWIRMATASTIIGALGSVICIISSLVHGRVSNLTILLVNPLTLLSRLSFEISVLCLGAYQLIEASSNSAQLSNYVWWHIWCTNVGTMLTQVTSCLLKDLKHYNIYASSTHFFLLALIIATALMLKRWIHRYNYLLSPLKLISGVLLFALKNRYPLKRSALTYWEELQISRINLGKTKYGGPFSEKDVESVKTFFRVLSLVAVVTMINIPYQNLGRFQQNRGESALHCILSKTYYIYYCVIIPLIPLYTCAIKTYCSSKLRVTMLKKISIGLSLIVVSKLGYIAQDLYISIPNYHNETICLLQPNLNETNPITDSTITHTELVLQVVNAFGYLFTVPSCSEFVFAQATHNMRGLLIGLWFGFTGFYEALGWMTIKPFKTLSKHLEPSCELYLLIMNFVIVLSSLLMFLCCSRCYKLHSNEEVFNAYHIAEVHYENEINRREQYGSISSSDKLEFSHY